MEPVSPCRRSDIQTAPSGQRGNEPGQDASAPVIGPAGLEAFLCEMGYEVRAAEPSKPHLTTRMVTSSLKPTPLQKSAALLKISVMRPSADREEPRRITPERRSVPNSSPSWFRASVTPSV